MSNREIASSGSPYESKIGFSRGVKAGNMIAISGTAPLNPDGSTAYPGDPYNQTKRCLEIIERTASELGADLSNAIRTRVYLSSTDFWEEVGKAHGAYFGDIQPACTFVEVSRFLRDDWLIEIEADFVLNDKREDPCGGGAAR